MKGKRKNSLTVLFFPKKQRKRARTRQARDSKSQTGKGRKARCAAQIRATKLDKMQLCRVGQQSEGEAGETTNKKSPDADLDGFLALHRQQRQGGRQRPEGQ